MKNHPFNRDPIGPKFSRKDLEHLSSKNISELFGEMFVKQDSYEKQVRMPEPPLLLADEILGIDAKSGSMGKGTLWSRTVVRENSWYLHRKHMTPGILVESGQADLLLISYLGIDFHNKGERVYRLLGCDGKFFGKLPTVGDVLSYEIRVTGHAKLGDIRLFFFEYECYRNDELLLEVKNGQAGFFTDKELKNSEGVKWTPEDNIPKTDLIDPLPTPLTNKREFSSEDLVSFSNGDLKSCFGEGFEITKTYICPPKISTGKMLLIDGVQEFDPMGGPWGRGYLKASIPVSPDSWYFDGHFNNDPCMPGTLMFDANFQALSFYMTAMGLTIGRDGWRFEPIKDKTYNLRCRAQATPISKKITCEIFIESIITSGDKPIIYADTIVTVDGKISLHCKNLGLELVPGWPMEQMNFNHYFHENNSTKKVHSIDGMKLDEAAMLATAIGRPSKSFGKNVSHRDTGKVSPRLPNPPYLCISRLLETSGKLGDVKKGDTISAEWDIDPNGFYFDNSSIVPFAFYLEAALQPCGWLSSLREIAMPSWEKVCFRNLDGSIKLVMPITKNHKVIKTDITMTGLSILGPLTLVKFDAKTYADGDLAFTMNTGFGFFTKESLLTQKGIPINDSFKSITENKSNILIDLKKRDYKAFNHPTCALEKSNLLMIDRIVYMDINGGENNLGLARSEKDVTYDDWYFKRHFFQDPVQPGSLGLEAMIQLFYVYVHESGILNKFKNPEIIPLLDEEITWTYRGQVVPKNKLVNVDLSITKIYEQNNFTRICADSWLRCDDLLIYKATNITLLIREK